MARSLLRIFLASGIAIVLILSADRTASADKKTEKPKAEKPKAEKPHAEKPKAEKPKAEKPHAEKPHAEKPNHNGSGGKFVPSAEDKKLAKELHKANIEIAKAIPDYSGHRGAAMDLLHNAVGALDNGANAAKPAENRSKNMTQHESDNLLRNAVKHLSGIQQQLAKVKNSPTHAQASGDVRGAIMSLERALSVK
jgi:hypothetical protein